MENTYDIIYREVGRLKKGTYVIYNKDVWRVADIKISSPGKHGAAKVRLKLYNVFDDKTTEIVMSADEKIEIPNIPKRRGQIIAILERNSEGKPTKVQVMDLESYEVLECTVPEELAEKVAEGKEVVYWDLLGRYLIQQISKG